VGAFGPTFYGIKLCQEKMPLKILRDEKISSHAHKTVFPKVRTCSPVHPRAFNEDGRSYFQSCLRDEKIFFIDLVRTVEVVVALFEQFVISRRCSQHFLRVDSIGIRFP